MVKASGYPGQPTPILARHMVYRMFVPPMLQLIIVRDYFELLKVSCSHVAAYLQTTCLQ